MMHRPKNTCQNNEMLCAIHVTRRSWMSRKCNFKYILSGAFAFVSIRKSLSVSVWFACASRPASRPVSRPAGQPAGHSLPQPACLSVRKSPRINKSFRKNASMPRNDRILCVFVGPGEGQALSEIVRRRMGPRERRRCPWAKKQRRTAVCQTSKTNCKLMFLLWRVSARNGESSLTSGPRNGMTHRELFELLQFCRSRLWMFPTNSFG